MTTEVKMAEDAWLTRLREERAQLSERLGKLNVLLADDESLEGLPNKEVALLITQSHAMTNYLDIIDRRLDTSMRGLPA